MLYPLYNSELWTKTLKNDSMKHGFKKKVLNFSNNVILHARVYMGESFCKISSQLKEIVDHFLKRKTVKNMPGIVITCVFSHKFTYF